MSAGPGHIWFTTTADGNRWSADANINWATSGPPGLAVVQLAVPGATGLSRQFGPYKQELYPTWQGAFQSHIPHTNANATHTDQVIANMTIDGPPGMTAYANTLLAVYATPTGVLSARDPDRAAGGANLQPRTPVSPVDCAVPRPP
jgi:hypothetical protein